MASTASALLKVEMQALGENLNTWGDTKLNDVIERLEDAICGVAAVTLNTAHTLTSTQYVDNEARHSCLVLTGTGGALTVGDATQKLYLIKNDCSAAAVVGHASGDSVSIPAGQIAWVGTDGSDFFKAEPNDFASAKLLNVGAGAADTDGVNKLQMDTADNLRLLKAGDTATGILAYGSDLSVSFADRSLVDKAYVDGVAMGSVSISFDWDDVTNKPTTIAGYAITDAYTKTEVNNLLGSELNDNIQTRWKLRP